MFFVLRLMWLQFPYSKEWSPATADQDVAEIFLNGLLLDSFMGYSEMLA